MSLTHSKASFCCHPYKFYVKNNQVSYLALPFHTPGFIFNQLLQKSLSPKGPSAPFSPPEDPDGILLWNNLHGAQQAQSHQAREGERATAPHTKAAKLRPCRSLEGVFMEI